MADAGTARLAAWVWLAVYLVVPIAGRGVIARQDRQAQRRRSAPDRRAERAVARPMPAALVTLLAVQGTALAAAGTVLFAGGATLHEPVDLDRPGWAWPVMPLTSQAIGAWLLAFAAAIIMAVRQRDLSGMFVPALAYAAFGAFELAVVLAHGTAPGMHYGWWLAGALVFASLVPTGAYGAWAARRAMPESTYRRSDVGFPAWRRTMARTSRAGIRAASAIASVGSPWRAARAMTDSQRSTASRTSRSLRAVALSTSRNARSASLASASKSISLTPPSGV
jgi:hypothetical protein